MKLLGYLLLIVGMVGLVASFALLAYTPWVPGEGSARLLGTTFVLIIASCIIAGLGWLAYREGDTYAYWRRFHHKI